MHVGILTGGGDCPGLNAVIRAVTLALVQDGRNRVTGIERGFLGLLTRQVRPLDARAVEGLLAQGGTVLGTHNRCDPFHNFGAGGADCSAQALAFANGTDYGLAASVFTRDLDRARQMAERLQAGLIWINGWMRRDLRVPFGGVKRSGLGREGGAEAMRFFTEAKSVHFG